MARSHRSKSSHRWQAHLPKLLAGLVGARMAQGLGPFEAACCAVAQHGQLANDWPDDLPLTASALAQHLR